VEFHLDVIPESIQKAEGGCLGRGPDLSGVRQPRIIGNGLHCPCLPRPSIRTGTLPVGDRARAVGHGPKGAPAPAAADHFCLDPAVFSQSAQIVGSDCCDFVRFRAAPRAGRSPTTPPWWPAVSSR